MCEIAEAHNTLSTKLSRKMYILGVYTYGYPAPGLPEYKTGEPYEFRITF
jgi:hypothetical protein